MTQNIQKHVTKICCESNPGPSQGKEMEYSSMDDCSTDHSPSALYLIHSPLEHVSHLLNTKYISIFHFLYFFSLFLPVYLFLLWLCVAMFGISWMFMFLCCLIGSRKKKKTTHGLDCQLFDSRWSPPIMFPHYSKMLSHNQQGLESKVPWKSF